MKTGLESGDLTIVPVEDGEDGTLCFEWRGRCAARSPSEILAPFFERVLTQAEAKKSSVEMRFHHLTHFNSSTVSTLLTFVEDARERQVRLTIVYDATTKWQRLSFGAMRVLSRDDGLFQLRGT